MGRPEEAEIELCEIGSGTLGEKIENDRIEFNGIERR
jgi:hypothetical protein